MNSNQRAALHRLYAYCRLLDDIADDPGLVREERLRSLHQIENWLDRPDDFDHTFWRQFQLDIDRYKIKIDSLRGIIEGVRSDLDDEPIETWEDLDRYCYGVACCVGEAVLSILGLRGSIAEAYAWNLGCCLQHLNIMRDLHQDQKEGRIYWPKTLLKEINKSDPKDLSTEDYDWIRQKLYRRAMNFREQARPFSWKCLPAEVMANIYILGSQRYWRLGIQKRLSKLEKVRAGFWSFFTLMWSLGKRFTKVQLVFL